MARDIKIKWLNEESCGDFEYDSGDYVREEGLESSVLISLFTDARADKDDQLDDPNDKRGWWANQIFGFNLGSKLWLLDRSKTDQQTLVKIKKYTEDALQWMIDDKIAAKILVTAEKAGIAGNYRIELNIKIYQKDGTKKIEYKFDDLWKGQMYAI